MKEAGFTPTIEDLEKIECHGFGGARTDPP